MRNKFLNWTAFYYFHPDTGIAQIVAEVRDSAYGGHSVTKSMLLNFLEPRLGRNLSTGNRTAASHYKSFRDHYSYAFDHDFNTIAATLEGNFNDLRGHVRYRRDHNLLEEVRPLRRGTARIYAARKKPKYTMEVGRSYQTRNGKRIARNTTYLSRRTGDRDRPVVVYQEERP